MCSVSYMVYTGDGYTCNFFHSENKYMTRQQFRKMRLERAFLISGYDISAMAFDFFMVTFRDKKKIKIGDRGRLLFLEAPSLSSRGMRIFHIYPNFCDNT